MDRRAFRYLLPYRWRLLLIVVISVLSTALSLFLPYLTKVLVDDALIARSAPALGRTVLLFAIAGLAGFALSVVSGLAYGIVASSIFACVWIEILSQTQTITSFDAM